MNDKADVLMSIETLEREASSDRYLHALGVIANLMLSDTCERFRGAKMTQSFNFDRLKIVVTYGD